MTPNAAYDDNGTLKPGILIDAHDAWPSGHGLLVVSESTGEVVERPPIGTLVQLK